MRVASSEVSAAFTFPTERLFWLLGFAYASFMALLLQKSILPLWPEMHAGHGLLKDDAIFFHHIAIEIAYRIQTIGWSEWRLHPTGASGNIGLLSAIYALFGPDPAWFIPFNAAAHATGALMIYRIGSRLVENDIGKMGGLLAAICFLVFPSALQWYGQIHKDAFSIAGLLIILEAWLIVHDDQFQLSRQSLYSVLVKSVWGAGLLCLVRPYFMFVMILGLLVSLIVASLYRTKLAVVGMRLGFIAMLTVLAIAFAATDMTSSVYDSSKNKLTQKDWVWQYNEYLPSFIDSGLKRASELRVHFVYFGRSVNAGSGIDGDRLPNTAQEAMWYMPRALSIGLFAPFPDTWGKRVNLPRLVGAMETACWYFAFLGAIVTLIRHRSRKLLAGMVFCAALITVLAYIHPNVGTLYRQRFGLWNFFMLIGTIGWASLLLGYLQRHTLAVQNFSLSSPKFDPAPNMLTSANRMASSGAAVILITMVSYLGFFARDLLLIGQLGLGNELDAFFSAAMIPMFFVSCLAMPLGEAFVLPFVAARHKADAQANLLQSTLGMAILLLLGVLFFVLLTAPWIIKLVLGTANLESQAHAVVMLRWFALIIALSAWTIIGNAALNSLGKPHDSAMAQLVVPAITIASLAFAPSEHAVAASIGGMLFGTLINALIVAWRLRILGFTLFPNKASFGVLRDIWHPYRSLVAAAILPAALIPLNYMFAASVGTGTVAAWAFSSKIVVLFTALASVGATAVVLPQLAHVFLSDHKTGAHPDANLLIALGIWLGCILMVGGFLFADPLVAGILGKNLSSNEITSLAGIIKIGLLQLPMAISGALVNRLAIASGHSSRVMYSAAIAFIGNILVNILLVPRIGVMGVAVGALFGAALSTIAILIGSYRHIGLELREIFIALVSWLVWLALCIALASESTAALLSTIIALIVIGRVQIQVLRANTERPGYTTSHSLK